MDLLEVPVITNFRGDKFQKIIDNHGKTLTRVTTTRKNISSDLTRLRHGTMTHVSFGFVV